MQHAELAKLLVQDGKISQDQLAKARELSEATGSDVGPILVKMGFITDAVLSEYLAKVEGVELAEDVTSMVLPEALVNSIPRNLIEKHLVIPIHKDGNLITLAMHDPEDMAAIDEIQFLTGMRIESQVASKDSIRKAITQFFYSQEQAEEQQAEDGIGLAEGPPEPSEWQMQQALIPLLIEKGIITEEELRMKAMDVEVQTPSGTPQS